MSKAIVYESKQFRVVRVTPPVTRDPRVDPRPGDVLMRGSEEREVICCYPPDPIMVYCETNRGRGHVTPWLSQWRKWAANAEVVHIAEATR